MDAEASRRYKDVAADLRAVHWEYGLDAVRWESETTERYMSEKRNQEVRNAIRGQKEPESMQLGKLLKKSHIQLSHRPDLEPAKTETKMRFVPKRSEAQGLARDPAELRKSHIDLAIADSKSGKAWSSVLKSTMSDSEDVKFKAERPKGFEELGEELRKSSVLLHAGRHDFRSQSLPVPRSTQKLSYDPKPISKTLGFAETIGKELQVSSIDVAAGEKKTAAPWQSHQHAIMGDQNDKKWACEKPKGFDHLIAELRKTNITLGSDRKTVYGSEGTRPIKDARLARPAGHIPGC